MELSGVAAVTATTTTAAAGQRSGFLGSSPVPSLSSTSSSNPFDPTRFGKAAVRAAHECGTVGQRTP